MSGISQPTSSTLHPISTNSQERAGTPLPKWIPLFAFWKLLLVNNEGYGGGLDSMHRREDLIRKISELIDKDDLVEYVIIIQNYKDTDLDLSIEAGKKELRNWFYMIAEKWDIPQEEIDVEVYEGRDMTLEMQEEREKWRVFKKELAEKRKERKEKHAQKKHIEARMMSGSSATGAGAAP